MKITDEAVEAACRRMHPTWDVAMTPSDHRWYKNEVRAALTAALPHLSAGVSDAACDVLAERRRQVEEEGWTPDHDDKHDRGEMAGAAACYALYRSHLPPEELMGEGILEMCWPWDGGWWKPKDRRRDLVRAGALILAEIERLDRKAARSAIEGASHE